ncbi:DUF2127 domain-containing protein [Polaromonas naphthalenivorans]|uniref:DUF2127 domain-containing protein n=1 Tax=Polaromonas naphthalenivorans (strain CJ2) TaxID=365044 RepID=A1VJ76_POLNA|nr:DUF2127 domain-containing protein [Polaromonas naphthalenivorans]ABM35704.1 conserved hypothetical protein [Polaromonas naphthalenivorans CJ2]
MASVQDRALKTIAAFEGLKGLAAIASGLGLLSLLHHDIRHLALELVGHFGLNPAQHFPSLFLHYVDLLNSTPVSTLMLLLCGYAALRLAEAYALWRERAWGALLGALSGGIYIPFEWRHLLHRPSLISAGVLAVNVLIVVFLAYRLWRRRVAIRSSKNSIELWG